VSVVRVKKKELLLSKREKKKKKKEESRMLYVDFVSLSLFLVLTLSVIDLSAYRD
jgi:hypothetical protein